jgi:hypothetical protein
MFFLVGEELQDLLRSSPCLRQLTLIDMDVREGLFLEMPAQVRCSMRDTDPKDPHVFGPPGSGSVSQRYGTDPDPFLFS